MSDEIKLVSLDNIKIVKSYIDKVRGELSYQIDSVTEHYLNEQLDDAKNAILNAYEEDSKELRDRIAYVEAFGQEYEGQLQELKLQHDALRGDFEHKNIALDALQTQLDILSGNYDELYNDITSGAIFNSGELDNIIKTAMIDEVRITENTVLTPEMYASKVVALIANFGSVKASNIESGVMAGSTIKSTNKIAGTNKPVWIIDNDGSGYLAKENIKWTREGDVTFGPDVKLSWSSISDGDYAVQSALNKYDDYIQNAIEDNVKLHTENLADDAAEILSASLIDHTELDGNHIATPSLFAKKIVGAIGTFGTVKADKIAGNTIQGYTISAPNTVIDESGNVVYTNDYEYETDESGNPIIATNSNGTPIVDADGNPQYVIATKLNADGQYVPKKIPAIKDDADISWALKSDGSGWLANHNIEWTDSGTVEFGSDVKLKWNSDWDSKIPEGGLTESDVNNIISTIVTKDYIESLKVRATDIIGDTIKGKTITDTNESSFTLDADGTFTLGQDAIRYDGKDLYISGDNVYIDGDVSINGQAVMTGIRGNDDALSQFNDMVAAKIDATEISTEILETKSDNADKIHIEDNYIHCINDKGDKNLIVSSDPLDLTKINKILGTGFESSSSSLALSNVTLTNTSTATYPYANSDVWYSHTSPIELGYILKGSSVNVYISLIALNVPSSQYNINQLSQQIKATDWKIQEGSGSVPFVVGGGGTSSYSGGCILIYKKNDSGDWEEYDSIWLTGSWYDAVNPWTSTTSGTPYYKTQGTGYNTISIDEDGEYGVLLGFEVGSIRYSSTELKSISGLVKASIDQAIPSTYTEIGKDGIVTYDGVNSFRLTSEGIEMRAKTSNNSSNFYGIKVTSDGMYIGNGGSSWLKWAPTGYGTSSGTWT